IPPRSLRVGMDCLAGCLVCSTFVYSQQQSRRSPGVNQIEVGTDGLERPGDHPLVHFQMAQEDILRLVLGEVWENVLHVTAENAVDGHYLAVGVVIERALLRGKEAGGLRRGAGDEGGGLEEGPLLRRST